MGKPSVTGGVDPAVQAGMLKNQTALTSLAEESGGRASALFNLTYPGMSEAEHYFQTLSTGDPAAILRLMAPAEQQAAESAAGAKANIMANAPSGGEKNLALEAVDVGRGAEISRAVTAVPNTTMSTLAALGGQGIGESLAATQSATSAYGTGSQTLGTLGGLEMEGRKIEAEQKGSMLGTVGGLAGDIFGAAGAAAEFGGFAALI